MNSILRERIDKAEEVIVLEIPEEWRGQTIDIEMRTVLPQKTTHTQDPDYNPDWKIGDTLYLIDQLKHLRGVFPEGSAEGLYGSAPDLEINNPGPIQSKTYEWLA